MARYVKQALANYAFRRIAPVWFDAAIPIATQCAFQSLKPVQLEYMAIDAITKRTAFVKHPHFQHLVMAIVLETELLNRRIRGKDWVDIVNKFEYTRDYMYDSACRHDPRVSCAKHFMYSVAHCAKATLTVTGIPFALITLMRQRHSTCRTRLLFFANCMWREFLFVMTALIAARHIMCLPISKKVQALASAVLAKLAVLALPDATRNALVLFYVGGLIASVTQRVLLIKHNWVPYMLVYTWLKLTGRATPGRIGKWFV